MVHTRFIRRHSIIAAGILGLVFMFPALSEAEDGRIADNDMLARLDSMILVVEEAKNVSPAVMRTLTPLEQRGRENLQEAEDLLVAARACLKDGTLPGEKLAVTPRSYKWVRKHLVNDFSLGKSSTGGEIVLLLIDVSNIKRTDELGKGRRETMNLVKHANDLLLRALMVIDNSPGLSKE